MRSCGNGSCIPKMPRAPSPRQGEPRSQGVGYDETYRMITRDSRIIWVRDRAEVERLADGSEVWRGSWMVVPEPAAEASDAT